MKPKFLTIADPIETFDVKRETTFCLLREISLRGFESFITTLPELFFEGESVKARMCPVKVGTRGQDFTYRLKASKVLPLEKFDVILVRKDPPVDAAYITHLHLLSLLEQKSALLFMNSPSGILKANEKIYPLSFDGISPATIVSSHPDLLRSFVMREKKVVVKPLNSSGGRGILILSSQDADISSVLDIVTESGKNYVMAQKFVPEAVKGDKRILLFNGEPLGSFLRKPSKKDFRGNLHSGATWVKAPVTVHERRVIRQLAPELNQSGLYFVGLDFLGPIVSEINVTSPMGIREINKMYGGKAEKKMVDWMVEKCGGGL